MKTIHAVDLEYAGEDYWNRHVYNIKGKREYYCIPEPLSNNETPEEAMELLQDYIKANINPLYTKCPINQFEGEPGYQVLLK